MPSRVLTLPPLHGGAIGYSHMETGDICDVLRPLPNVTRRMYHIIAFKQPKPISKLSGDEFVAAWLDCVKCHYRLWRKGIQHRDPSLSNLMYYKKRDEVYGVLNDWDLANVKGRDDDHAHLERTGTIPFMPLQLLSDKYWQGKITRTYWHDLESFIWILAYVVITYRNGEKVKGGEADAWITGDYILCRTEKWTFLSDPLADLNQDPPEGWTEQWPLTYWLLHFVKAHEFQRNLPVKKLFAAQEQPAVETEVEGLDDKDVFEAQVQKEEVELYGKFNDIGKEWAPNRWK